MYVNGFLQQYAANQRNLDRATVSETTVAPPPSQAKNITDSAAIGIPLGFLMAWVAILFIMSKTWTSARKKMVVNIKPLNKVPCRNCKYFSGNHYLKCALHPSTALTEEAIDCSDYCRQKDDLSPQ
jgi:hypothetical protein